MIIEKTNRYFERRYLIDLYIYRTIKLIRLLGVVSSLLFGAIAIININDDYKDFINNALKMEVFAIASFLMNEATLTSRENLIMSEYIKNKES